MPEGTVGYSKECLAVLRLLRDRHNVLISGAPGTGKSRLLMEVAKAFTHRPGTGPVHVPGQAIPIPATPPPIEALQGVLPASQCSTRQVFQTVFHQGTKHRDFITGLVPVPGGGSQLSFRVTTGTLFRASEHARKDGCASLVIIDEINRGPAVQIFGGSIVAIEADKRLLPNGERGSTTQMFEIMSPPDGATAEYTLPHHVYLLAAMNQADTSIEPLDVAFLRRWTPFHLEPNEQTLTTHFRLSGDRGVALPDIPSASADIYEAAVRAWLAINRKITLGRGSEFRIGHGILMGGEPPSGLADAQRYVAEAWRVIMAHIEEVFFGDTRGVAAVLNLTDGAANHVYSLRDVSFADEPRMIIDGPDPVPMNLIYQVLLAVGRP